LLLALDTATTTASLALYDLQTDRLLCEYTWEARRRQTEELLITAQKILAQVGHNVQAITALAVTTGPGSFTGVRIGISTVKGIGVGLPTQPKVIGLPTLAVAAAPWIELMQQIAPSAKLCAIIRAGRGRYNWAFFAADALLWRPVPGDHDGGTIDDLITALRAVDAPLIWLAGEVDAPMADAVGMLPHVTLLDPVSGWRRAGQLARLAALHFAAGTEDDLVTLQPLYLRNP